MNKKEVQQRVLQNGKPLDLDKFEWDEKTNTFSSDENDLVLDFSRIGSCTFKTGYNCTFKTGSNCTFDCKENCVVVRRDVYEVIELNGLGKIKLNELNVEGYTKLEPEETIQIGDHTYSKKEVEERLQGLREI